MNRCQRRRWVVLSITVLLVACQSAPFQPQMSTSAPPPTSTPPPSPTPVPPSTSTPPSTPSPISWPVPSPTSSPTTVPTPAWPPRLNLPYTPTGDDATGYIRGRLSFPSEYIPPLTIYAVATDGRSFFRVDTEPVPPGEPEYEITEVEPGTYHVYGYPAASDVPLGGAYSYLAACEAGHFPLPPEGCWTEPQHDLAPVEVRAGQAVEEINLLDWYGPALPPPPDATGG